MAPAHWPGSNSHSSPKYFDSDCACSSHRGCDEGIERIDSSLTYYVCGVIYSLLIVVSAQASSVEEIPFIPSQFTMRVPDF